MHQSEIMNRNPIPSDPFNRQYIYKGVVFHWSLATGFVYLICLAISKASPISIVLLIPSSVVLFYASMVLLTTLSLKPFTKNWAGIGNTLLLLSY